MFIRAPITDLRLAMGPWMNLLSPARPPSRAKGP